MKKRAFLLLICLAMAVTSCFAWAADGSGTGDAAAADRGSKIPVAYGTGTIELELVENYAGEVDLPADQFGQTEMKDGVLHLMADGGMYDKYDIKSDMLSQNTTLTGAKYIVFSIENLSDDACLMCFQPTVPGKGHVFLSGTLPDKVLFLTDTGVMTEGVFDAGPEGSDMDFSGNARYAFLVPYEFQGYVLIPISLITLINEWDAPLFTENPVIEQTGFHVIPGVATYCELTVDDMFITGDLPEYVSAEPTETPATATPEAIATATATKAPDDNPGASGQTEQPAGTPAPGKATENPSKTNGGNNTMTIVIVVVCAVVVIAAVVCGIVVGSKKKKK